MQASPISFRRKSPARLAQQAGLADQSGLVSGRSDDLRIDTSARHPCGGGCGQRRRYAQIGVLRQLQAKACAFAIAAEFDGSQPVAPHLFNTCFTFLAADDAVTDAISFKLADGTIKIGDIFISKIGESPEARRQAVRHADGWYDAFTHDVFG